MYSTGTLPVTTQPNEDFMSKSRVEQFLSNVRPENIAETTVLSAVRVNHLLMPFNSMSDMDAFLYEMGNAAEELRRMVYEADAMPEMTNEMETEDERMKRVLNGVLFFLTRGREGEALPPVCNCGNLGCPSSDPFGLGTLLQLIEELRGLTGATPKEEADATSPEPSLVTVTTFPANELPDFLRSLVGSQN